MDHYGAARSENATNGFGTTRIGARPVNEQELIRRLENLRIEHRDLDAAIAALTASGPGDQLQLMRLKKRKLRLKDLIAQIEDRLTPDITA